MQNPMRAIRIGKVTVNIGCGESGERLDKAKKLLQSLTKRVVAITKTHKRTTFGMPKGRPIGVKITLRGSAATAFLKRALEAVDYRLPSRCFDNQGNLSFGIKENIDLPGVRYDPDIGIFGMDVCVTLERPGFCIKRKKPSRAIGRRHRITATEAAEWIIKNFGVKVIS